MYVCMYIYIHTYIYIYMLCIAVVTIHYCIHTEGYVVTG